jgi:hypothetical protein
MNLKHFFSAACLLFSLGCVSGAPSPLNIFQSLECLVVDTVVVVILNILGTQPKPTAFCSSYLSIPTQTISRTVMTMLPVVSTTATLTVSTQTINPMAVTIVVTEFVQNALQIFVC